MKQKQGKHKSAFGANGLKSQVLRNSAFGANGLKSQVLRNSAFGANGLKSQVLRNSAFGGVIAILLVLGAVANLALSAGSSVSNDTNAKDSQGLGNGDLGNIWQWQNCDCKFEKALSIDALTKEQKVAFAMCGSPQMAVIDAKDLAEAYSLYRDSEKDSALLETLPNSDKTYSAKNATMSKKLKITAKDTYEYSFSADRKELKLQIHGVSNRIVFFFVLENGKVKIVRTTASF